MLVNDLSIRNRLGAVAALMLLLYAVSTPLASAVEDFNLTVTPILADEVQGRSINYTITLTSIEDFNGNIEIQATGVPENSTSNLTPKPPIYLGRNKTLSLNLTISTTSNTPLGLYTLNITASTDRIAKSNTVILNILGPDLFVSTLTEKNAYSRGESVAIIGTVVEAGYRGVFDADVSIKIIDPTGTRVYSAATRTVKLGYYYHTFTLAEDAPAGTYVIFTSASKEGFKDARAYTTFTVTSGKPSIKITSVKITDATGNVQTTFTKEAMVTVWVTVQNQGLDLENGLIWIEIDDPNDTPIAVMYQYATVSQGQTSTVGFSAKISTDQPIGEYAARAFVSDKLISQGGRFLAIKEATFIVG